MVSPYDSMLFAWTQGKKNAPVHIAAAHTDFPMLKLKPNPELTKKGYVQMNVEPYGGLIMPSWFDRPLGLAGKVVLAGTDVFHPSIRLYDSIKPLFIIPNLAPHLKHGSKNQEMDVQKELLPIGGLLASLPEEYRNTDGITDQFLLAYIAKALDIDTCTILDYDLYLYVADMPQSIGLHNELLTAARIDNISSVSAILEAIVQGSNDFNTAFAAFFDNEEIGSRSKQGADSLLLRDILERIHPEKTTWTDSFNLSVDVAHATHPNYTEKNDITNDIILGNGFVLKSSASQRYVTDSEANAIILALCKENTIPLQRQANRSGMAGGTTLGPLMSSYLPIRGADVGIPVLAMHSAMETACTNDYHALVAFLSAYFQA